MGNAKGVLPVYRQLTAEDPTLAHAELDRYRIANSPAFDAVKNLRDWLLHPGYSRQTDKATSMFWDENGEPVADRPESISVRLLQFFGEVAGKVDEFARQE